jgi:preprotein translocase subunit SecF
VRAAVDEAGFHGAEITEFGTPVDYTVKAQIVAGQGAANADSAGVQIKRALEQRLGAANTVRIERTESVGPRVGQELKTKALVAILISFLVTLVYLAVRFEWRFGVAAVAATAHDILTTLAFLSMMHLEVSLTVVAALLTVVGYSLNDTIIIFDRVRENERKKLGLTLAETLNLSINETLPRTVITHGTSLSTMATLAIFGGEVIRPFAVVMFFGVFSGIFSSMFIAPVALLYIRRRWPRFGKTPAKAPARPAGQKAQPVA